MPPRTPIDVYVVDRSALARNMYQLLFSAQRRYRVLFGDEFEGLAKKSARLRPDLLIVNENSLTGDLPDRFPCRTVLLNSDRRVDLRERYTDAKDVVVVRKPFYPFDLLSVSNRLTQRPPEPRRGRRPGKRRS